MSTGRHWVSRHNPVTQSVRDDEGDIESYLEEVGGFHFLIFIREDHRTCLPGDTGPLDKQSVTQGVRTTRKTEGRKHSF